MKVFGAVDNKICDSCHCETELVVTRVNGHSNRKSR